MSCFNKTYKQDQILKVLIENRHVDPAKANEVLFLFFKAFNMSEEPAIYQVKTSDPIKDAFVEALEIISSVIDGFIAGIDERLDYYKNENTDAAENLSFQRLTEYAFGYFYIGMNYFWKDCFNQQVVIDESIAFDLETCNQFQASYSQYQNDASIRLALHAVTDDRIAENDNIVNVFPNSNKIIREYFDSYFEPSDEDDLGFVLFCELMSIEGLVYEDIEEYLLSDEKKPQKADYADHILTTFMLLKKGLFDIFWKDWTPEKFKEISVKNKWGIWNEESDNVEAFKKFFSNCDIIFDAQRPEDDDYGLCADNAICTSSISCSELYLDNLRTEDGHEFTWHRNGSCCVKDINGIKNVMVDAYQLFLKGKEYKEIFICPYGRDSTYVPKGFMLALN